MNTQYVPHARIAQRHSSACTVKWKHYPLFVIFLFPCCWPCLTTLDAFIEGEVNKCERNTALSEINVWTF